MSNPNVTLIFLNLSLQICDFEIKTRFVNIENKNIANIIKKIENLQSKKSLAKGFLILV